jgi:GNAT superfamily N-acetyltransferase
MTPQQAHITIERVTIDRIVDLRHRVLRAGLPADTARFDGDEEPGTIHLAAVDSGVVVGCATLVRRPIDGRDAWQLRGMATAPTHRGQGLGAALLEQVHRLAMNVPLWCNARLHAIAFYERHGWRCVSDVFDIPTAGPHRRMVGPNGPAAPLTSQPVPR